MPCSVELRGRNRRSRGASSSERAPKSSMGFPTSQRGPTLNSGKSSPSPHQVLTKSSPSPHQVSHECKSPLTISALRAVCHTQPPFVCTVRNHLVHLVLISFSSRSHLVLISFSFAFAFAFAFASSSNLTGCRAGCPRRQHCCPSGSSFSGSRSSISPRFRHMSHPVFATWHTPVFAACYSPFSPDVTRRCSPLTTEALVLLQAVLPSPIGLASARGAAGQYTRGASANLPTPLSAAAHPTAAGTEPTAAGTEPTYESASASTMRTLGLGVAAGASTAIGIVALVGFVSGGRAVGRIVSRPCH